MLIIKILKKNKYLLFTIFTLFLTSCSTIEKTLAIPLYPVVYTFNIVKDIHDIKKIKKELIDLKEYQERLIKNQRNIKYTQNTQKNEITVLKDDLRRISKSNMDLNYSFKNFRRISNENFNTLIKRGDKLEENVELIQDNIFESLVRLKDRVEPMNEKLEMFRELIFDKTDLSEGVTFYKPKGSIKIESDDDNNDNNYNYYRNDY